MGHTSKNNPGKVASGEWHRFRQHARETAHSPAEFSDVDRTRYNLDDDDAISPAGITGQDHVDYDDGDDVGPGDRKPMNLREDPWR